MNIKSGEECECHALLDKNQKQGVHIMEMIKVVVDGQTEVEVEKGITLAEMMNLARPDEDADIMLAFVNGSLSELGKKVEQDSEIRFVTTRDKNGRKTYVRGVCFMMLKAAYEIIGNDELEKLWIDYSIGESLYCLMQMKQELTQELLDQIAAKMMEYVERDIPFEKSSVKTEDCAEMFGKYGMYDKQKLFKYRRVSRTNIYSLDGFKDYFYGYMPGSTGNLKYFALKKYDDGFMLELPDVEHPHQVKPTPDRKKLFYTLKNTADWGKLMNIETVGDLNDVISSGGMSDLILVQESLQEKRMADIAAQIIKNRDNKFIMIAGPSSSGKTTFSHRLSIELMTHGLKPHPIPLDDYFKNREDTPKDENGNYDFECLEAIDVDQFNEDMSRLLKGDKVELPVFNFKTGKREYKGKYKKLEKDEILVIEGIHGLNDQLSFSLPRESKFKIYISALTQLNIDEHNRIPTTDARLIRRMVRDARTRGTSAQGTIAMWPSVRRGEEKYIFPFQEDCDVMFNSALIYELSVLKIFAEPILFGIDRDSVEYVEAKRLLKFLDYFMAISSEDIPRNSIVREFIGGSLFNV